MHILVKVIVHCILLQVWDICDCCKILCLSLSQCRKGMWACGPRK